MSDVTHFDAIIVGSGQGGNPLAVAMSENGKRTAVIERAEVGGTCVNYGCTPTKTMVASADVASKARRGAEYGIRVGEIGVDMPAVRERKRNMVKKWREGSEKRLKDAELVELIRGEASFVGPKQLRVRLKEGGERTLTADLIVLNTGLRASKPPLPGIEGVTYLDNASVMELDVVPEHLLVLGGGYVGLEFAQMFRRFGSSVTVIQRDDRLATHEDQDISDEVAKILTEDGIEILLDTTAESVATAGKGMVVTVKTNGVSKAIEGTHLLVAVGRRPNTEKLNLQAAGVAVDAHGYVKVNDKLETSAAGVYAIGDVKGGPAFTHISYDDHRILKSNLLEGGKATIAGRMVPSCMFMDPQLGSIGLNEREAKELGKRVRVARLPMTSVARAMETSNSRGFMKALVDPETDEIVGATILGEGGGEVMSMIQIAMMGKLKYQALRDGVLAHPLLAESLNNLFNNFDDE